MKYNEIIALLDKGFTPEYIMNMGNDSENSDNSSDDPSDGGSVNLLIFMISSNNPTDGLNPPCIHKIRPLTFCVTNAHNGRQSKQAINSS